MKLIAIIILAAILFSCSKSNPTIDVRHTQYELYIYDSLGVEIIFTKNVPYPITPLDSAILREQAHVYFNDSIKKYYHFLD